VAEVNPNTALYVEHKARVQMLEIWVSSSCNRAI
jgi:hypothetical protein